MIKTIQICRICGNPHLTPVINLGNMHIQGAFEKEGVASPPRRKVPNEVVRCDTSKFENGCGAIQARHSIDPEILYRNYWYESGISQTMRDHLKYIVDTAYAWHGRLLGFPKRVLDIACNDGTLLRNYPKEVQKWGIDPSDIAGKQEDLNIVNECYPSCKFSEEDFDIITTIACFYDVHNPVDFAENISLDLNTDGMWVVEFAYWPAMLEKLAYDQILAEHIVHYTLHSFQQVCEKAGLKVFHAEETPTNGGSLLCFVCREECDLYANDVSKELMKEIRLKEFDLCLDEEETYKSFRDRVFNSKAKLNFFITKAIAEKKMIHILGASTKLNTVLGYCGIGPWQIGCAAERSPEKHGAKTLSGIPIVSEEESRAMKPDYYIVGPYHFRKEIVEREKEYLKGGGKLVFCLPEFTIVSKDGESNE